MGPRHRPPLAARRRSYAVLGGTSPETERWRPPRGWRGYERTVRLGAGQECWDAATTAVMTWGVKTRSGFSVEPSPPAGGVRPGQRYWLRARVLGLVIREPVAIVADVSTDERRGFAYGTLDGHPVSGEEAFIVHRDAAGTVWFTLRSLTRTGRGRWRWVFPVAVVAQRIYRRRYLRALLQL